MTGRVFRSGLMAFISLLWLSATGVAAAQMAEVERQGALAVEFQRLRAAQNAAAASIAEQEIWRLWFTGPSDEITARLEQAAKALQHGDFLESETLLTALILKAPNYAELWNQRAFARFLQGKFDKSLQDIDRALMLEPRHFGALAGRARIEAHFGRLNEASRTMGEVGAVHPWLARTSPIPADPPPPPPVEQRDL